jgi:4-hydroxybutyrate CoA-transferase
VKQMDELTTTQDSGGRNALRETDLFEQSRGGMDLTSKMISADDAAKLVKNGMRVGFGWAYGGVPTIEAALVQRSEELKGVEVGPLFPHRASPMTDEALTTSFRRWCIYALAPIRDQVARGTVEMAPPLLGFFQRLGESGRQNPHAWDVYFCRTSLPDADGFVSLGSGYFYSKFAIHSSKMVVFELDESMPRPCGDTLVSIDEAQFVVQHEKEYALGALPRRAVGEKLETADVIGAHAATLVNDGDTIQIGGGTASAGLYGHLFSKNDIGYHAEMAEDLIFPLVESGNINGSRKTINQGVAVAAGFRGVDKIDSDPRFAVYGSDYTNNPLVIAQHENFIAVNSCIATDLTGQVTSESIDGHLWGGPGGQLEFVTGALLAKNGRSVMCVPSTTADGRSRIVADHPQGTVITTPRTFADFFVTEFGVAALLGKTELQRAMALIEIAHPSHRDELTEAAERRFGRRPMSIMRVS